MTIQWYPGHMHKAQKEIKQALPDIDLIIEVVDARIPYSSANPVIADLAENKGISKPIIKLMNKTDLADPARTAQWCEYLEKQQGVKALPVTAQSPEQVKKVIGLCRRLAPQRTTKELPVRAMIMGIPNVGKSTIINILSQKTIAKVGNEPAVTQRQQRIDLKEGVILFDTPGILWPKIDNTHSSYRLAISGAIKDTALDYEDVAFYAIEYLLKNYQSLLAEHFKLDEHELASYQSESWMALELIGRLRGCLKAGGRIDMDKVCKILIHEYRAGNIGKITLESPAMIEKELIEVAEMLKQKAEKKAARKAGFKKKR
ncbi:ribosome biogenesis GTPase YlqF [Aliikangiella maris]|uniref:Ribosome biogenesis GTPase A n=2 Tax=Aliikangiella maris TaxID=3162458 RepID=A0ABV2BWW7_9GAMM